MSTSHPSNQKHAVVVELAAYLTLAHYVILALYYFYDLGIEDYYSTPAVLMRLLAGLTIASPIIVLFDQMHQRELYKSHKAIYYIVAGLQFASVSFLDAIDQAPNLYLGVFLSIAVGYIGLASLSLIRIRFRWGSDIKWSWVSLMTAMLVYGAATALSLIGGKQLAASIVVQTVQVLSEGSALFLQAYLLFSWAKEMRMPARKAIG